MSSRVPRTERRGAAKDSGKVEKAPAPAKAKADAASSAPSSGAEKKLRKRRGRGGPSTQPPHAVSNTTLFVRNLSYDTVTKDVRARARK